MLKRSKFCIFLWGIIISTWTPLCYGQLPDSKAPLNEKIPQTKTSPHLLPENLAPPAPATAEVREQDKKVTKKGWYWNLLEWTAINFAVFNTMKQSDGRPNVPGKSQ